MTPSAICDTVNRNFNCTIDTISLNLRVSRRTRTFYSFFPWSFSGLPQHTKNREDSEIGAGAGGHRVIGLLVGALSAATVLAGASVAFVMVRRRRQVSGRSLSRSLRNCSADKPHLPPAIHLTVSPNVIDFTTSDTFHGLCVTNRERHLSRLDITSYRDFSREIFE